MVIGMHKWSERRKEARMSRVVTRVAIIAGITVMTAGPIAVMKRAGLWELAILGGGVGNGVDIGYFAIERQHVDEALARGACNARM
jgi:hypothetical protein